MTLTPRFRPGTCGRPFVNREAVFEVFDQAFGGLDTGVRVLNLTRVAELASLDRSWNFVDGCRRVVRQLSSICKYPRSVSSRTPSRSSARSSASSV